MISFKVSGQRVYGMKLEEVNEGDVTT